MRSRTAARLAAATVALLGIAACGDDDDDASATDATEAAADETTTTAEPADTTTAPPDTTATDAATLAVGDTGLGPVVVDAEGFTLYLFTNDAGDTSVCTGGCADTWPPLIADEPVAGEGLDEALAGTIARDDGGTQVTYNGHPLYRFASDEAPGDANGQGIGGVWFAVDASGNAVES